MKQQQIKSPHTSVGLLQSKGVIARQVLDARLALTQDKAAQVQAMEEHLKLLKQIEDGYQKLKLNLVPKRLMHSWHRNYTEANSRYASLQLKLPDKYTSQRRSCLPRSFDGDRVCDHRRLERERLKARSGPRLALPDGNSILQPYPHSLGPLSSDTTLLV